METRGKEGRWLDRLLTQTIVCFANRALNERPYGEGRRALNERPYGGGRRALNERPYGGGRL